MQSLDSLLTILILTKNEERHIERCIQNARKLSQTIIVVDTVSTDDTVSVARLLGVKVISRSFDNFAEKMNWSLTNIEFTTQWILRLDADELVTENVSQEILSAITKNESTRIAGFYLRRQLWFMGRWMRHGGMYPTYSIRLWRKGHLVCEQRELDEHMILTEGVSSILKVDVIDAPLTDLSAWIVKHNRYSSLEVRESLKHPLVKAGSVFEGNVLGNKVQRTRWLKFAVYDKLPLFVRPILYFIYRYIFLGGFLDGREGFIFHFLHGLWYRVLIDAKIYECSKYQWRS